MEKNALTVQFFAGRFTNKVADVPFGRSLNPFFNALDNRIGKIAAEHLFFAGTEPVLFLILRHSVRTVRQSLTPKFRNRQRNLNNFLTFLWLNDKYCLYCFVK